MKLNAYCRNCFNFYALVMLAFFSILAAGCKTQEISNVSSSGNQTPANRASTPKPAPVIDNSPLIGKYRGIDVLPDNVGAFHILGDDSKQVGRRWASTGKGNVYYPGADEVFVAAYGTKNEMEVTVEVAKYGDKAKAKKDYDELTTPKTKDGFTLKLLSKKPFLNGIEYAEVDRGIQYTYFPLDQFIVTFWGNKREQFDPFIEALKNSKIAQDASSK